MPQPSQALPYHWVVHSTPLREILSILIKGIITIFFGSNVYRNIDYFLVITVQPKLDDNVGNIFIIIGHRSGDKSRLSPPVFVSLLGHHPSSETLGEYFSS